VSPPPLMPLCASGARFIASPASARSKGSRPRKSPEDVILRLLLEQRNKEKRVSEENHSSTFGRRDIPSARIVAKKSSSL
jgi:hypothetical protein